MFGYMLIIESKVDVEQRFVNRDYNNINLVTNAFQAPGFYEKWGFQCEYKRENLHHPQLTKLFFIIYFSGSERTQGTIGEE